MPRFFLPQPSRHQRVSFDTTSIWTRHFTSFSLEYSSRSQIILSSCFEHRSLSILLCRPSQPQFTTKARMLRRPPTAITLTTEDIAIYEDTRTREALQREQLALQKQTQQQQSTPQKNQNLRDPNDQRQDRARGAQVKTREERLGLGGGASSSRG